MKRFVLFGLCVIALSLITRAQNVFDPGDEIIRYDASAPLGSAKHPDPNVPGLQKWVSTPTIGVSLGTDTFDTRQFKQYFLNVNGAKMAFRLKYPYSYGKPGTAGKKYPVNLFLHGGGEVGCPSNGGIYNNEKQVWLGGKLYLEWVNTNKFDGFLLYPQLVVSEGCFAGWGTAASANFNAILAIVDSLAKYAQADIDRLLVDGLSGGGYGAWRMADAYPKRVAKIMPSASAGSTSNRNAFVHIPIWFATGGKDLDPSPEQAQYTLKRLKEIGANVRYTVFPERGHSCWYQHWREPDFVPEMNNVHKANPLVFFQHSEFCKEEDVNAKLGITPGFYAYEWQRDGVTIATATNNVTNIIDGSSIISYTGNEITVKLYGTYQVRFKRTASSEWSDWSLKPAVITTKGNTQTLPIQVKGKKSRVLPSLDGSTTVPLTLADGFVNYQWYRASDESLVNNTQVYEAPVGEYKARYEEEFGCGTAFSPPFTVVDANGNPKPDAPTSLTAVPATQSSIKLTWKQGAGENGFEVYRATTTGGPYQFVELINANLTTYTDTGLAKNTMYHYKIRAVSETGASVPTNEATAKTLVDNEPPTAPSGLAFTVSTKTSVRLTWKVATDNEQVARYDIYVNGVKTYSVPESGFTATGLDSLIPYTFVVKAVDAAGNVSPASNQVTYVKSDVTPGRKPGIPSGVAAEALDYTRIKITWADTISNETGFEITRSTTDGGTYVPIGTAPANATSFTDSGLDASKKYFYRIRAIGANGESGWSPKVNATTLALPDTPASPPQLSGEAASNGSVLLSWTDVTGETNFKVYRSEDNVTFTLIATLPANSNAYADAEVTGFATYYYYVVGSNSSGNGMQSNTLSIRAGNNPPAISGLDNIYVKAASSKSEQFSVTDDAGDVITISIPNKPSFVTLTGSNGNYSINASPTAEHVGVYDLTVIAKDNNGKSTTQVITLTVGDQFTKSVYVNLGSSGKSASSPWNNWLGIPGAGSNSGTLKDEQNAQTALNITMLEAWSGTTDLGHITGDNSGVAPDAVLRSGISDNSQVKNIKFSGLNRSMQYNLVFVGSQNEGYEAKALISYGSQSSVMDSRYNTSTTANLNSIVPDANGEILVTITRAEGSPAIYLNGIIIEEYASSIALLNPNNLAAEPLDRTSVRLTWSDRTNNESAADGYEITRATDSLFTQDVVTINRPANSNVYTNSGLSVDKKYWYRVRAKGATGHSGYSKRVLVATPGTIVYVNFNVTVADAPAPWNSLTTPPLSNFTTDLLKDQSNKATKMALTLEKEFNGEFTAGMVTGNNSGVVPDNALAANYWLDKSQLSQFKLTGLNHSKRYRIGFFGSSGPVDWFKGNYTATYTVHDKTVYLNSWYNTTKVVYINDIAPDPDGKLLLDFSTTPEAGYGFNAGVIIEEYAHTPIQEPVDTTQNPPVDTIPNNPNPPVDTIPNNPNPPVDTIPNNPNPPVDTIPNNPNPPVDTIPNNPNPPVDTIPNNPNPPVDTIPNNPNPPVDTIPNNPPPPVDTLPNSPPPVDTIPDDDVVNAMAYPNPFKNEVKLKFYNSNAAGRISVEIHDTYGKLIHRQDFGTRVVGNNVLVVNGFSSNLRIGMYLLTLRLDGEKVKTLKVIKSGY
ncbi:MAG: fibronectin type III domain-containing protein [Chitinophagaceae bacterium]|nr:fibronectin type III domain-containing protein [Chitinophagaceae bacterium]